MEASVVAAVEKVDENEEKRDKATDPLNTYLQVAACLEDIQNMVDFRLGTGLLSGTLHMRPGTSTTPTQELDKQL